MYMGRNFFMPLCIKVLCKKYCKISVFIIRVSVRRPINCFVMWIKHTGSGASVDLVKRNSVKALSLPVPHNDKSCHWQLFFFLFSFFFVVGSFVPYECLSTRVLVSRRRYYEFEFAKLILRVNAWRKSTKVAKKRNESVIDYTALNQSGSAINYVNLRMALI